MYKNMFVWVWVYPKSKLPTGLRTGVHGREENIG